ncbi:unnamed protein product [Calicophoron daubneyi]|uniref:Rho-GAP domain-containing protein n=1 Tax=Calicophoron daubneyi TaxID=300641 RepID=A0AAV2TRH1_CALDB
MLNSSSGDTDSSASDKKAQSSKPDKSRAQEFRRTTPRQIKQHQQRHNTSGNFESKVSKPTSGTPEKGPQKFADQPNKPYPADLAASLIRTASLHLRSTLSRLKRSNSGHATTKGIVTDAPQIAATAGRRCSDPLKPETLENHKAPPISQNERKMDGKVIPQVTLVAGPKFVDNRTREPPKPDSSPLPPGYSRWSTRLGPPPPTVDESATKNVGNSVPLRRPEPPQTGDFKYVPPKPCNTSTPIVQLEKCPLWKSNSLAPVYHSLPTGEADDLNLLADDCADFGELGRINLRTGSFMGRYTQSRAQNTRPQFPSAQILYQRNLAPETTPNRLSPSRPLYLSPYQGTSSGNTTRSAPSPSLSSVTSAPGMSVQEPILARQKAVSLQSSRPNPDLLSPLPKNAPVSSAAPFVELDPVLTRLLLDVSSIDEYRSALRPQNIQTRSLSLNPNRISTTSEGPKSPSQSNVATSALSSALGSSDPGSMGLLGNQIPQESKQRTPSEELLEESWDLSQQINDLIQMEFACQAQRISPARALPKTRTMPTEHTRNGPRLSEPNVAVESDLSSPNGFGPGRRTRQHPFRWSSGTHHHQSSQKTHKLGSETAAPHVQKNRPGSTVLSRGIEAGSLDRGLQSGKHQQMFVSVEPLGGDVTDNSGLTNSQLSESVFYSTEGITGGGRRVSFWSLNTVQMAVLRKLSLVQITSFAEKHCTNRSPFNWRFLKYRAIGVTGDSLVQAISPTVSPTANKKIDIHVSEPSPPTNNDSGVHQENVHAAFSQSLSTALDRTPPVKPIDGDIHPPTPSRTAYTGPVFGQSLGNWQRRLGYPLPAAVVHMMNHLERIGTTAHGIFRRPGGKIRTQALREEIERDLTWNNFDDWQPYDVADLLKQFFRELPECLLTSKLSVVLVNLFNAVPESSQLDLLRWVVLGLPDENRVALQKLLYLLHSLLRYAHITQMSANNLAVCFAPSLFRLITSNTSVQSGVGLSPRRLRRTTSGPDPKDLADQRTAQLSLSAMITHAPSLFEISSDLLRRIHLAPPMNEPGELESIIPAGDWPSWIQTELRGLIRECSTSRPKGWSMPSRDAWKLYHSGSGAGESLDGLEVYFKKPVGTNENSTVPPLRTWRCSLPIPEPNPQEILGRFWNQRASWDPEITRIQVIEDISDSVDVCLMINTATFPQPNCGLHLLRGRQCVLEDGGSAMLSQSVAPICLVSGSNATTADTQLGSNPCGHVYEDHVYIKPLPDKSGCRVYLLSRVDLKGYSPDWYVNHWGHVLARRLLNLRRSFQPKNASFVGS